MEADSFRYMTLAIEPVNTYFERLREFGQEANDASLKVLDRIEDAAERAGLQLIRTHFGEREVAKGCALAIICGHDTADGFAQLKKLRKTLLGRYDVWFEDKESGGLKRLNIRIVSLALSPALRAEKDQAISRQISSTDSDVDELFVKPALTKIKPAFDSSPLHRYLDVKDELYLPTYFRFESSVLMMFSAGKILFRSELRGQNLMSWLMTRLFRAF